jgi:hypothetical protein
MTKKDYCDYRGWVVPIEEDVSEMVVLVEYPVDEKSEPNHENHKGYISMSPLHVFEKAYRKEQPNIVFFKKNLADPQQIVVDEQEELYVKVNALDCFIHTNPLFEKVDPEEQELLRQQLIVMKAYKTILIERILKF